MRTYVLVQVIGKIAIYGYRVFQFLETRLLVIQTGRKTETHVYFRFREKCYRGSRAYRGLAVEIPIVHPDSAGKGKKPPIQMQAVFILDVSMYTCNIQCVYGIQAIIQIDLVRLVWNRIPGRIPHLPFVHILVHHFPHHVHAPVERIVFRYVELTVVGDLDDRGRHGIAGMFIIIAYPGYLIAATRRGHYGTQPILALYVVTFTFIGVEG